MVERFKSDTQERLKIQKPSIGLTWKKTAYLGLITKTMNSELNHSLKNHSIFMRILIKQIVKLN